MKNLTLINCFFLLRSLSLFNCNIFEKHEIQSILEVLKFFSEFIVKCVNLNIIRDNDNGEGGGERKQGEIRKGRVYKNNKMRKRTR